MSHFTKTIPMWEKPGSAPTEAALDAGWRPGDKPPADWFNWQWYNIAEALKEVRDYLDSSEARTTFYTPADIAYDSQANTFSLTTPASQGAALTAYNVGMSIRCQFAVAATDGAKLSIDGLPALPIYTASGDIVARGITDTDTYVARTLTAMVDPADPTIVAGFSVEAATTRLHNPPVIAMSPDQIVWNSRYVDTQSFTVQIITSKGDVNVPLTGPWYVETSRFTPDNGVAVLFQKIVKYEQAAVGGNGKSFVLEFERWGTDTSGTIAWGRFAANTQNGDMAFDPASIFLNGFVSDYSRFSFAWNSTTRVFTVTVSGYPTITTTALQNGYSPSGYDQVAFVGTFLVNAGTKTWTAPAGDTAAKVYLTTTGDLAIDSYPSSAPPTDLVAVIGIYDYDLGAFTWNPYLVGTSGEKKKYLREDVNVTHSYDYDSNADYSDNHDLVTFRELEQAVGSTTASLSLAHRFTVQVATSGTAKYLNILDPDGYFATATSQNRFNISVTTAQITELYDAGSTLRFGVNGVLKSAINITKPIINVLTGITGSSPLLVSDLIANKTYGFTIQLYTSTTFAAICDNVEYSSFVLTFESTDWAIQANGLFMAKKKIPQGQTSKAYVGFAIKDWVMSMSAAAINTDPTLAIQRQYIVFATNGIEQDSTSGDYSYTFSLFASRVLAADVPMQCTPIVTSTV